MSNKSSGGWVWAFAIGAGLGILYLISRARAQETIVDTSIPGSVSSGYGLNPPTTSAPSQAPVNAFVTSTPEGNAVVRQFRNTREGVQQINDALARGERLQKQGETLAKISTPSGRGTISRLATGNIVKLTVKQPERDSKGRTAMDRIIAKNKALNASKSAAKRR